MFIIIQIIIIYTIFINFISGLTIQKSIEILKQTKNIVSISKYKDELIILYNSYHVYREDGADYYIGKPLDPRNLYSILDVKPNLKTVLCSNFNPCSGFGTFPIFLFKYNSLLSIGIPFRANVPKLGIFYLDELDNVAGIYDWYNLARTFVHYPFDNSDYISVLNNQLYSSCKYYLI